MFSELIVIDNFLEEPDFYYDLSQNQKYYTARENPTTKNRVGYNGKRTLFLEEEISKPIICKIISNSIRPEVNIDLECDFKCLFHTLSADDIFKESNIHQDSSLYAGVIYINKNVKSELPDNGTLIRKNNEHTAVPYMYNRLVFYRSDLYHSPLNGFGNSISDSRLSINLFLSTFNLKVENKLIDKLK